MAPKLPDRRWIAVAGITLLIVTALALGAGVFALYRWYQPPEFPGAVRTSDRNAVLPGYSPVIRRDTAYHSDAPFNEVYRWYSLTFQLGPEQYGHGTCIAMARSRTVLGLLDSDVGVTVCDTPGGQTIIVSRSLVLRLPHR